jgi:hypothetical protein
LRAIRESTAHRPLVASQFEFQLCVGANGSYQASGPPDIRQ